MPTITPQIILPSSNQQHLGVELMSHWAKVLLSLTDKDKREERLDAFRLVCCWLCSFAFRESGCLVGLLIGISGPTQKGRNKDRGSRSAINLPKPKKEAEKQRGRLVFGIAPPACHCNLQQCQKKKSQHQQFDQSSLPLIV